MAEKKRVRSTAQQLKMLTEYMATHPRLAHSEFNGPQGKTQKFRQWEQVRVMLREFGPDKSVEQWEHTWRDLRRKARHEGSIVSRANIATGNSVTVPVLSEQSSKILGIMGAEGAFGISGAEESRIGFTTEPPTVYDENNVIFEEISMTPTQEVSEQGLYLGSDPLTTQEPHPCFGSDPITTHAPHPCLVSEPHTIQGPRPCLVSEPHPTQGPRQEIPRNFLIIEPLPKSINRPGPGRFLLSDSISRAINLGPDQDALLGNEPNSINISGSKPFASKRRQGLGSLSSEFLQAELDTNHVLREISNNIEISNQYAAMRLRLQYKKRIWQLRKDAFK